MEFKNPYQYKNAHFLDNPTPRTEWGKGKSLDDTKLTKRDRDNINSLEEGYFTPAQFYDLYQKPSELWRWESEVSIDKQKRVLSPDLLPEENLLLEVLREAYDDMRWCFRGRAKVKGRRESLNNSNVPALEDIHSAWLWFHEDRPNLFTSFSNICNMFSLPQEAIRRKIFDES